MKFRFTKMQGLGNDFVVIDAVTQFVSMNSQAARRIADRRYGIGCDQILLIESANHPQTDFNFRIFNSDGSEAYQCGNGARCAALFIRDQKLSEKAFVRLKTSTQFIEVKCLVDGFVQVNMGRPKIDKTVHQISIDNHVIEVIAVDMGNPHGVIFVDQHPVFNAEKIANQLNVHSAFPSGLNVSFARLISSYEIDLRVIERGSGATLACGSGACAAMAAGRFHKNLDESVCVYQPGGELTITWRNSDNTMYMSGSAARVFDGEWSNGDC